MSNFKLKAECRYSENVQEVLTKLGAKETLFINECDDWQGFLDVDVLLNDGRVFSYRYDYGSCSGCDEWEGEGYNNDEANRTFATPRPRQ